MLSMPCAMVPSRPTLRADGALELREDAALQAHLSTCADCQHELAALRQTRALVRALPTPALARSFTLPETPETRRMLIRPVPGWARHAQQLGVVAAMIGVALLCASAVPSIHFGSGGAQNSAAAPNLSSHQYAGSASSTAANSTNATANATKAPAQTDQAAPTLTPPTTSGAAANVTPTPQPTGGNATNRPSEVQPAQPFPILPVSGGVLLVGGIGAAVAGSVARRRPRAAR